MVPDDPEGARIYKNTAEVVGRLPEDETIADPIGANARERVRERFLATRRVSEYLEADRRGKTRAARRARIAPRLPIRIGVGASLQ